jgi:beta-galactosidase
MNHDYTEEYANYYHHEMLKTFAQRPYLWSTHVWNMFDFAADARNEGSIQGRNDKGLVTYDRKLKKDAYFIYQAYWTAEPMVYIAGRRWVDRAPEERNITVYTNCDEVTLVVNGVEIATQAAVDHAVVFENVALKDGENVVSVRAGEVSDTVTFNGVAEHNPDYTLPDIAAAMAVGNWFDEVADNEDSDEIVIIDGYYSVDDTAGECLSNEECLKIVKGWFMTQGNLTYASMLTTLRDMMGFYTIRMVCREATPKQLAQLNRLLSRVKK